MTGKAEDILRLNYCPRCGYDLGGLPGGHVCPECGFEYEEGTCCIEITGNVWRGRWPNLILILGIGICVLRLGMHLFKAGQTDWTQIGFDSYLVALFSFPLFFNWMRYRWEKEHLPYKRLIVSPRGFAVVRAKRIRKRMPWLRTHHVHFDIRFLPVRMRLINAERGKPSRTVLNLPVVLTGKEVSALHQRISEFIGNVREETA